MILANKWDTNGGNTRFAEAAKKALILHAGQDYGGQGDRWRMTALHVAAGQETAGIGTRYAEAAAKTENLVIRAAHRSQTYLDYPYDILWDRKTDDMVRQLAREADVVHLNDRTYAYFELGLNRLRKPALLHHHGMAYRVGSDALNREARRLNMVQAVSTVDLLRNAGEGVAWLPAPYDIDALLAMRKRRKRDGRILVAQTPTNRAIKSTDKLEEAVRSLQAEGVPVDLAIGEQMPWRESLALKATADIFFDQVQLGYGCSAIEAWGMKIPVIAGGDSWTEDRMRVEFGTDELPFYKADDDVGSIRDAVRALAKSSELRREWASRGHAHARKFHDELPALTRLVGLYYQAIELMARPAPPSPTLAAYRQGPGVFRSTKYPALSFEFEGMKFKFRGGELVADETSGQLVRAFVGRATSAIYGITEHNLAGEAVPAPSGASGDPVAHNEGQETGTETP